MTDHGRDTEATGPDTEANGPDTEADRLTASRRQRGLAVVMASAVTVGLTLGMTIPLIALNMTAAGAGAALVGINAAMPALAVLATAPWAPRLIARFGTVQTLVLGCVVSAAAVALFPVLDSVLAWFGLRFAMGFGLALQWVVSETWLSRIVLNANRGRAVSLYATLWAAGIAVGPMVLHVTGITGAWPFVVATGLLLLAAVPPLVGRRCVPAGGMRADGGGWSWALFRVAPGTILAGFAGGFAEIALFTLLPLYGEGAGLGQAAAVLMVSMFAAGGLGWQLPLGWFADRVGSRRVLVIISVLCLVFVAGFDLVAESWLIWPLLFLWGGATSGYYTLGLTEVGHKFPLADLAHANVLFIMAYTVGTISGPSIVGAALDLWPRHGLPMTLAVLYCLYLGATAGWERRS